VNLARVVGTIWATRKVPDLDGAKIQVIEPLSLELEPIAKPIAAVDTVGAGEGELVTYVTAYEAVIPFFRPMVPIDASIVGIVDHIDHERDALALVKPKAKAKGAKAK
jgi:microcompartment protein CcmK/EutM